MNQQTLKQGDRVEVLWDRHGWLPGTFVGYTSADDRPFRVLVEMDNGFACHAPGYAPECVRAAQATGAA